MKPQRKRLINALFKNYIRMYAARDARLIEHFSENFSGYTGARLYGTALHATFSGYYNGGEARMTRGYGNAGVREYTQGEADVETTAVRARLDWLNAVEYGNTAFTPYASVTDTRTTVAAYRESGGAFPDSATSVTGGALRSASRARWLRARCR